VLVGSALWERQEWRKEEGVRWEKRESQWKSMLLSWLQLLSKLISWCAGHLQRSPIYLGNSSQSGNVWKCLETLALVLWCVKARDATKHPTMHNTPFPKTHHPHSVSSAEAEKHWARLDSKMRKKWEFIHWPHNPLVRICHPRMLISHISELFVSALVWIWNVPQKPMCWRLGLQFGNTGKWWKLWEMSLVEGHWKSTLKGDCETPVPSYLLVSWPWDKHLCTCTCSYHNELPHHSPKAVGPTDCGLNPQSTKLWAKTNLFFL
jgi:hypothetical protein